jgi:hypothetical protein
MHRRFRCEYGAGLWKEDLPKGLCWYVEADITHSTDDLNESIVTTQQNNHAPSWSWAAKAIDPLSGSWIGEVALDYQNLMMTECNAFPDELAMSVSYLPLNITDVNTEFEEEHVCRQMFALVLLPHDIAKQEYRRVGLLWKFEWATDQSKWQIPTPEEIEEDNRQTVHIV